ncbi:phosphotransferase [Rhodococcus hoagii]|nr:phosphotransferase [Prescottella equi]
MRAELVRVLAALHAVDHRAVGLEYFGRPEGYLSRQVALWARQWERVRPENSRPRATARVAAGRGAIHVADGDRARRLPDRKHPRRRDDPGRVVAVVDWELSTLGIPSPTSRRCAFYRHRAFGRDPG